jgi:hypothetical protein
MDYEGQKLSELLFYWIICSFGAVGWVIGYIHQDFIIVFYAWLVGVVLSVVSSFPYCKNISHTKICRNLRMVMLPHNRSCACQIGLSSTDTQYNGSSPFQIDGKARELVCGEKVFSTGC